MFHIYDERALKAQLRMKRVKSVAVFLAGTACGLWFAHSGQDVAIAAPQLRAVPLGIASWCHDRKAAPTGLRLDCALQAR